MDLITRENDAKNTLSNVHILVTAGGGGGGGGGIFALSLSTFQTTNIKTFVT